MTQVTVAWQSPLSINSTVFPNRANCTLYVHQGCQALYQTADYWKEFKEIIEFGEDEPVHPVEITDISLFDNVIYIEKTDVVVGNKQVTLSVKMKNNVAAEGFSFDLHLPDGMSVATDEDGFPQVYLSEERTNSRKTNTFERVILSDGGLRVFGASTNGGIISGNDGEIVVVNVNVANVKEGEYPVILKNIVISDEDAKAHEVNDVITFLRVIDYVLGDVNMDGKINVADYTSVAHHIMGNTPEVFNKNAADANHDGKINVADLTAIAHIIMYGSVEKPHAVKRKLIPFIPE